MMRGIVIGAVLAAVAMPAMSAMADVPGTVSFFHGGAAVTLPIPTNYCLPRDDEQTRFAAEVGTGTPNAQIEAVLLRCDRAFAVETVDYTAIVSPNSGSLAMPVSRAELIRSTRAFLASNPDMSGLLDQARSKAADRAGKAIGEKVDLTEQIVPRGVDDDCVYLGGTMTMSIANGSISLIAAECMSVVNNRVIAILRYRVGGDGAAIPTLQAEARAILLSMRGTADT